MKIVIRPFNPESDSGLIYDSYPKGVFYGRPAPTSQSRSQWMNSFYETVKEQLAHCHVRIACTDNDLDTILGYSIISPSRVLHFVYVKSGFRNNRIGTILTKNNFTSVDESTVTTVGRSILSKLTQGDPHGKTDAKPKEES